MSMGLYLSELVRTFIAIEIENKETLHKLIEIREQLVSTGADVKPVEDENIHLTLRFIGEIPIGLVKILCNDLSSIKYNKFRMMIKGIGAFPSLNKPRVVWAGITEGGDRLGELHRHVETIIKRLGLPPDREEFIPHITLLRVKSGRNIDKLVRVVITLQDHDFGYSDVTRLFLKKSTLTPSGPIYSNLCWVELL